jgi:hypothetical protein
MALRAGHSGIDQGNGPADHIRDGLATALVGNMRQLCTRALLEQFAGDVWRSPNA